MYIHLIRFDFHDFCTSVRSESLCTLSYISADSITTKFVLHHYIHTLTCDSVCKNRPLGGKSQFWTLHMNWMYSSSSLQRTLLRFGSWFGFWDILTQSVVTKSVLSRKRRLNIYFQLNRNILYSSLSRNTQALSHGHMPLHRTLWKTS